MDNIILQKTEKLSSVLFGPMSKKHIKNFRLKYLKEIILKILILTYNTPIDILLIAIGMRTALSFPISLSIDYLSLRNAIIREDLLAVYLIYKYSRGDYVHLFLNFSSYIKYAKEQLGLLQTNE